MKEEENKSAVITTKINNSITPSIKEIERFILFLNNKFNLDLPNNIIINIEKTSPRYKGFFRPSLNPEHYKKEEEILNQIVLSSHYLNLNPYETIAHEVAHFINYSKGIKDCSNSQYHNKKFKIQAEKLLLIVEKTKKGYNHTKESPAFLKMLEEFKPSPNAFNVFQSINDKQKKKANRNLLYICDCGVKIRTAKNESKPLNSMCLYCNSFFKLVEGEDE